MQGGNIPSAVQRHAALADGRRRHPELRLHRVRSASRRNGCCPHFHNGIDLVAPYGTPVKASGAGTVVYIGWNYADGADPAWIVIIAHCEGLQTWYAHMQPRYPGGLQPAARRRAGQVIGYEGNTGHSTGAHLHWAVVFNGDFVNPRLFL